jgi:predicted nucleic acid-binding protein
VYLIDTNVLSETRKGARADPGVKAFFERAATQGEALYVSVVTVGELRRGVELIRHRGDADQARTLESWLTGMLDQFLQHILSFDVEAAQVWGRLRVPHPQNELDKQIAAIGMVNGLIVVTRNTSDFADTGVKLLNPFDRPAR